MGRIVVLGEATRISGFGLAGASLCPVETPEAVRAAWRHIPNDVSLVLLTRRAAEALPERLDDEQPTRLTAVLPT